MGYTVEKISGNQVRLHFEVSAQTFGEALQKTYLKMRGKIRVPGFRPGKAPRKIIERMYGETVFYDDAMNDVVAEEYDRAVEEHDLFTVDHNRHLLSA